MSNDIIAIMSTILATNHSQYDTNRIQECIREAILIAQEVEKLNLSQYEKVKE
jgi:hypothetical protein